MVTECTIASSIGAPEIVRRDVKRG